MYIQILTRLLFYKFSKPTTPNKAGKKILNLLLQYFYISFTNSQTKNFDVGLLFLDKVTH